MRQLSNRTLGNFTESENGENGEVLGVLFVSAHILLYLAFVPSHFIERIFKDPTHPYSNILAIVHKCP